MNIWHISDTHGVHKSLSIPQNIDIIIHSGDFSNSFTPHINEFETYKFLEWYSSINIPTKILISGNHDVYSFSFQRDFKRLCEKNNIIYLNDSTVNINGLKIFGSPYVSPIGRYHIFMTTKLHRHWDLIEDNTDIVITHSPPYGILDFADNHLGKHLCGSKSLYKKIMEIQPKYHLFGHIHNNYYNKGVLHHNGVYFSNGSCIVDNKHSVIDNGNIFSL